MISRVTSNELARPQVLKQLLQGLRGTIALTLPPLDYVLHIRCAVVGIHSTDGLLEAAATATTAGSLQQHVAFWPCSAPPPSRAIATDRAELQRQLVPTLCLTLLPREADDTRGFSRLQAGDSSALRLVKRSSASIYR